MKKISIIALVMLVLGLVFASCKKNDYTCSCTYTDNGQTVTVDPVSYSTNKASAQISCDALQAGLKTQYADASCNLN